MIVKLTFPKEVVNEVLQVYAERAIEELGIYYKQGRTTEVFTLENGGATIEFDGDAQINPKAKK